MMFLLRERLYYKGRREGLTLYSINMVLEITGPVQLVVACGPFTTSSNLLYEPLTDFLTTVRDNPPHILILLGPFLDANHPLVVDNNLGETHDAVFNRCIRIIANTLER